MRRLRLLPLVAIALLSAAVATSGSERGDDLVELLDLRLGGGETFRLLRLSDRAVFAVFASDAARAEALEGIGPEHWAGPSSGPALSLTDAGLAEAYAAAPALHGVAARFRDELAAIGFLPASWERKALITLVETGKAGELFDFSTSAGMEAVAAEADALAQGRSTDARRDSRLTHFGPDAPDAELFEAWKFDDLPDVVDEARARDARQGRKAEARRARFVSEAVRALYWVDPAYEPAVIGWIEDELRQDEVNLLAQLLQIAGVEEISAEALVRESAPHLHEPSVLTARLYHRLERVSVDRGRKGRALDPAQFPDAEVLARAEAFYARFFAGDDAGAFRFELTPEVGAFVDARSARVREITRPYLERLLGEAFTSGPAAGESP